MAETIRDVVIRLSLKQVEAKLKVPDLKPAEKAATEWSKTTVEKTKIVEKHFNSVRESIVRMSTETVDGSLKMGESLRTAGDGAFTLARGLAFTWAGSQEDMQKALQTIAKFQGAFDIFRGGVDVVKGSIEAWRAYHVVTTAAETATVALTTATVAQTTATEASTIATLAATLAANPVKAALAAAGLAVAALGGYYLLMGEQAGRAADETDRLNNATNRFRVTSSAMALAEANLRRRSVETQLTASTARRGEVRGELFAAEGLGAFQRAMGQDSSAADANALSLAGTLSRTVSQGDALRGQLATERIAAERAAFSKEEARGQLFGGIPGVGTVDQRVQMELRVKGIEEGLTGAQAASDQRSFATEGIAEEFREGGRHTDEMLEDLRQEMRRENTKRALNRRIGRGIHPRSGI
jgi:hypothetical protein